MKNLNKIWEKIRTNQGQYTLKIIKILRKTSLGSNFTGSYKKKSVFHQKNDKEKSYVNNLNNPIEAKIFCLNSYQVKNKDLLMN